MDLTHEFTVPASKAETWAALNDLESVAGCFPGATVTSVEGDTFTGSCKVKLGPIALVYNGSGSFTEKDEAAGVMKIEAKGKDKRGNGTAGADVVATISEVSETETKVVVVTDLNITGKPAQFGRGVIQDISDKLLGQFVECLKTKVGGAPEPAPEPDTDSESLPGTVVEERAPASVSKPTTSTHQPPTGTNSGPDDALDLGATVIPILLRTYGKAVAAALGMAALIIWIARRR